MQSSWAGSSLQVRAINTDSLIWPVPLCSQLPAVSTCSAVRLKLQLTAAMQGSSQTAREIKVVEADMSLYGRGIEPYENVSAETKK